MEKQAMKRLVRSCRATKRLANNIRELFGNAEQLEQCSQKNEGEGKCSFHIVGVLFC